MIYGALGALIFSLCLVCDAQMRMNGDHGSQDLSRPFAEFGKDSFPINGANGGTPTKNEVRLVLC